MTPISLKVRFKKAKSHKLTERDIELLKFINLFGFCEMPYLEQRFGLKKPRSYQVVNRLVEGGLVKHERVFHGRPGIYRLSPKGAQLTGLPRLVRVPLATYHHDITLIQVYLRLRVAYPQADWISARSLLQAKHADGVGRRGHLPDGVLVLEGGKQVAIEVELTMKGRHRLEKILKSYAGAFDYGEVWYYCAANVAAAMRPLVEKLPFIKIYSVKEFLA
ncbi:MAG: MarR family winged helix-turn-helix transcriptional regulator [Pseudomonadota bacterium]|nr:MarR family winged helix-turn-helix transcriptional regulator [Pseudomonadota bacterium]